MYFITNIIFLIKYIYNWVNIRSSSKKYKKQFLYIFLFATNFCNAQNSITKKDTSSFFSTSLSPNKTKIKLLAFGEGSVYAIGNIGLYNLWYKNYSTGKFHFFNDNKEWLYMDKLGHSTISFYFGWQGYNLMRWAGVSENKSLLYGGCLGFVFLSTVEIMDGFSNGWGFSNGDIVANAAGTIAFIAQQKYFHQPVFKLKNSYHDTQYSQIRPNLLGGSLPQRMLKDYNGQTYWLTGNLQYITQNKKIPNWLCFAFGYGIDGFVGATSNVFISKGATFDYSNIKRHNQFYVSLDVDLSKINTKYKMLNTVIHAFGLFKIPFPAIEFNKVDKMKLHPIYF